MEQPDMFETQDDLYEALRVIVMRLGGPKVVGKMFWPEKTLEAAAQNLNSCLNRDRPEKLDLDQIDLLVGKGRALGCHAFMDCMGVRHNYRIEPIEPEDERARLQRQVLTLGLELKGTLERLERVSEQTSALRSVK